MGLLTTTNIHIAVDLAIGGPAHEFNVIARIEPVVFSIHHSDRNLLAVTPYLVTGSRDSSHTDAGFAEVPFQQEEIHPIPGTIQYPNADIRLCRVVPFIAVNLRPRKTWNVD